VVLTSLAVNETRVHRVEPERDPHRGRHTAQISYKAFRHADVSRVQQMAPAPAYAPPTWSALPGAGSYKLEIIREGVVIESLDVSQRSYYILGRDPGSAQVVLPHPSVSRQHAVIQHRDSGGVWLMDLGSTHGTTLNKKPCPPKAYVRLPVGATVRLGTGTRLACLMGPPDEADPAMSADPAKRAAAAAASHEASAARLAARAERIAKTTGRSAVSAEALHGGGAGWGFSEDAAVEARDREEEELDGHGFEALLAMVRRSELKMSVRQQRLLDQLEKRTDKIAHLAEETGRIAAKESEGLSAGQTAALGRNEARSSELAEQVESLKEQLAESIREQLGAVRRVLDKRGGGGAEEEDDDEDDFFDRTAKTKKKGGAAAGRCGGSASGGAAPAEEVLSEATLSLKLEALEADDESVSRQLASAEAEQHARQSSSAAGADELDSYMRSNAIDVGQRKVAALHAARAANARERARLTKLIQFVRPALRPEARQPAVAAKEAAATEAAAKAAVVKEAAARAVAAKEAVAGGAPAGGIQARAAQAAAPPAAATEAAARVAAKGAAETEVAARAPSQAPPPLAAPKASAAVGAAGGGSGGGGGSGLSAVLASMREEAASTGGGGDAGGGGGAPAEVPPAVGATRPVGAVATEEPPKRRKMGPSLPPGARGGSEDAGDSGRRASKDAFRDDFAAALQRIQTGEAAPEAPGVNPSAEEGAGLGFGAVRPDAAAVRSVKESLVQEKRRKLVEASMAVGLNQMSKGVSKNGPVQAAAAPPRRGPIGPARPREQPDWRAAGASVEEEPGEAVWAPPVGQDGSGKTALNAKLGY